MKAIGIDIGTTSVCGVLIDAESGSIIKSYTKESSSFINECESFEKIQSVDKIMSVATEILEALADDDTAAIGVTGQMHGIVYVDKNARAVSPLYTWQDERGNIPYENTTYAGHLNSFSGYGSVTDFYNRKNNLRPDSAVCYCTIQDYFVMQICNLEMPVIHSSNAASFGLYDLYNKKLNYDCGAKTVDDYLIVGSYKNIPVSIAIGDNQASVFSTLVDENAVLLNFGTGSQVSVIADIPIEGENIETRPYFEGKYLVVGAALCGGRAYSMLKDFYARIIRYHSDITDDCVYDIMARMLESEEETSLTVSTAFAGVRGDADVCGEVKGINTENFTPEQLTKGFINGMTDELYTMYKRMNVQRCALAGAGNGIRKNAALVKALERKFGGRLRAAIHLEEAAFGAALFALISAGIYKNADEAHRLVKFSD